MDTGTAYSRSAPAPRAATQKSPAGAPLVRGSSKSFHPTADPDVLLMVCEEAVHGRGRSASIPGTGRLREEFCFHFYRILEARGIETHLARRYCGRTLEADEALQPRGILVRRLDMIALELIARYIARGQWADAHKYPLFAQGHVFGRAVFDCSLKWRRTVVNIDAENLSPAHRLLWSALRRTMPPGIALPATLTRDDPRVPPDALIAMHEASSDPAVRGRLIESLGEWDTLRSLCLAVGGILRSVLEPAGFVLEDCKIEAGRVPGNTRASVVVGDELSPDCMRVRDRSGGSVTKDLFRQRRSNAQIVEAYSTLTDLVRAQRAAARRDSR